MLFRAFIFSLFILFAPTAAHASKFFFPVPGHLRALNVPKIESFPEVGQDVCSLGPKVGLKLSAVPKGQEQQSCAKMPKIQPPQIDGDLTKPVWKQAAVSDDFWCSLQNKPPSDKTEVLVMRDDQYLYFGFRLYDKNPESIQAHTIVRDVGLGYDDSITVQLDTFFNRRDISSFSVNARGTQTDDIAGGRSGKIEWKGDWLGAAMRTDYGWSAEFAIPFAILNYRDGDSKFGANFMRYQSRTKEYSYWANVTPQALDEEMGQLDGLVLPSSSEKKAWDFMPFLFAGVNVPDKKGEIKDALVTTGMDVRYQPRADLTGMLSINPDFSQIEKAVSDISFSYSEKAVDDNRPFFVEGKDYFNSKEDNNEYFYSLRVPDFNAGAKAFGRAGQTQFGVLATESPNQRYDFAGRTLYEINDTNSAIATVVGSQQPGQFNNLLTVAQLRGRQPSGLNYAADIAATETGDVASSGVPDGNGLHYKGSLGWQSDYLSLTATGDQYDTEYFPADALLDQNLPGTRGASFAATYSREEAGSLWQEVQGSAGTNYRSTLEGMMQSQKDFVSGSVEFSNDMRVGLYHDQGPFRPVTATRGVFQETINHDRYNSATLDLNTRSAVYAGGLEYDWGYLGGGNYQYYSAYGWWRPVNPVYLNVTLERVYSFGVTDQVVATASWNITPQHTLSARYIYSEASQSFRVAFGYQPRKGLDVFLVIGNDSSVRTSISIKIVKTF